MNLGFSTIFPRGKTLKGKPTGFIRAIKRGDKIHSIREDKTNRWKKGNKIHFCTGLRTKKYKQFHLGECKGTQRILIIWTETIVATTFKYGKELKKKKFIQKNIPPTVVIGNKILNKDEINILARNDGFKNSSDFFEWFNINFIGKIIHFTNFKY